MGSLSDALYSFLSNELGQSIGSVSDLKAAFFNKYPNGLQNGLSGKVIRPLFTGKWYTFDSAAIGDSTIAATVGTLNVSEFSVPSRTTFTNISLETTVAGSADSTAELCVYEQTSTGLSKVLQQSVSTSAVAVVSPAISLTLDAGIYYIGSAIFGTTAPTVRSRGFANGNVAHTTAGNENATCLSYSGLANAAAVPATMTNPIKTGQPGSMPKVMLKVA